MRARSVLRVSMVLLCLAVSTSAFAARKKTAPAKGKAAATKNLPRKAAAAKSVAVLPFGGPLGKPARVAVFGALKKRPELSLAPTSQVDAALKLMNPDPSTPEDYQSVARALDAAALVQGAANKKQLLVRVVSGATGEVLAQQSFTLKNGNLKPVQVLAWPKLKKALLRARAPTAAPSDAGNPPPLPPPSRTESNAPARTPRSENVPPPPPPVETSVSDASSSSTSETTTTSTASTERPAWLDVTLYGGTFLRFLSYTDDVFNALSKYSINRGAPWVGGALDVYPLVLVTDGFARNIGLTGLYQQAVGLSSVTEDGSQRYTTTVNSYEVGLKLRIPFGLSEASVAAEYGGHNFVFGSSTTEPNGPPVPDVSYRYIRAGLGGRVALGERFALFGSAAYLLVLSSGEIATKDWFPRLSVGGVEGQLGLAFVISGPFEARATASYRHYFYSMNPEVGDANVAGGALDQYLSGTLGVALRLR